jgi:hypothetical protein
MKRARAEIRGATIFLALFVMFTVAILIELKICAIPTPWWYQFWSVFRAAGCFGHTRDNREAYPESCRTNELI